MGEVFFFFFNRNVYLFGCIESCLWHEGPWVGSVGSSVLAQGLSIAVLGLSCLISFGILTLSWPGIPPVSPALEGRFLTTEPPGKLQVGKELWRETNTCWVDWRLSQRHHLFIHNLFINWYQIANIHWIIEKAREFQKNIYFCSTDYAKAFDCVDHNKLENSERHGNTRPPDLPLEKSVCRSGSNS